LHAAARRPAETDFDYPNIAKGRLLPAFFVARIWFVARILLRPFISRSTNKCRGTGEVPEQLISPFVVGAGNDAQNT
jgi:hypothetical protein